MLMHYVYNDPLAVSVDVANWASCEYLSDEIDLETIDNHFLMNNLINRRILVNINDKNKSIVLLYQ